MKGERYTAQKSRNHEGDLLLTRFVKMMREYKPYHRYNLNKNKEVQ